MSHVDIPNITLNDNTTLPGIGFGTYKLNGSEGVAGMMSAIRNGYRLLDSAFNYENEGAVGEAVRQAGIPRAELRVTSKLPGRHHRYSEAIATIEESLYRAQLDYYAPFGCQLSVDLDRSNFHEPWVSFIPCLGTPSPGVFQDIR